MRYIFLLITLFLVGCGYKPMSHHVRENLGNSVFIEVKIDTRDPQNSVILKDEMSKMIFEKFHLDIADKNEADNIIEAEIKDITFSSLAENTSGFATFYRCEVVVEFKYSTKDNQKTRIFTKRGGYNLSLGDSSIITDSIRMEAINKAALKALEGFISQVGIELR